MNYITTPTFQEVKKLETQYGDLCEKTALAYVDYQDAVDLYYAGNISRKAMDDQYLAALTFEAQSANVHTALEAAKVAHLDWLESIEDECDCTPITDRKSVV